MTSSTAPITIAHIPRTLGHRLGLDLPLLIGTQPHFTHLRRLPLQEPHALYRTFVQAQDVYTFQRQLRDFLPVRQFQHLLPELQRLGPLLVYDGTRFLDRNDLDNDDDTVVLQIPPGNSILRPRRQMAAPRPPVLLVERLMATLQRYYWYWSTGRNEDDEDDDDQWYALYPQVYSRQSHFQFPRRPT